MMSPGEIERALQISRQQLFQRLDSLGIDYSVVPYPAHATVEEGKRLRGKMAGTFTKNLLLKDKHGRCFLLVVHEDRRLDLKALPALLGAHRSLSFAKPDIVWETLGVLPGALTPMGLQNANPNGMTVVVDDVLLASDQLNFHPMINTESIGLSPANLMRFLRSTGQELRLVQFD